MQQISVSETEPLTNSNDAVEVIIIANAAATWSLINGEMHPSVTLIQEFGGVYYTLERAKKYVENWLEDAWQDTHPEADPSIPRTQYVTRYHEYDDGEWSCDVYVDEKLHYRMFKTYLRR